MFHLFKVSMAYIVKDMFFVVLLKTQTPDKPTAIHYTALVKKFEQKGVFRMFIRENSNHPKEYSVECIMKDGKPRGFYKKNGCKSMVNKLAEENGYFVRYRGNTWGLYKKVVKVRKKLKPPKNPQYEVAPIPPEELRNFVIQSINDYSPIDEAAKVMFERQIPVFSVKTRMFGIQTLFSRAKSIWIIIMDENMAKWDALNKYRKLGERASNQQDFHASYSYKLLEWSPFWYDKKKVVNELCARLTKLYQKTPGSRKHTVDAIEMDLKEEPVVMVI